MKNKKLQKLLQEAAEAAAEPVHDDKPERVLKVSMVNGDIYTDEDHEQAEDVEGIVVESVEDETDLGDAAAEPVHNNGEATQDTPEVETEDVYTDENHEQAEDVEGIVVESSDHIDYEGKMAKIQLRKIMRHAQQLHDQLEDHSQLPAWIQSKLTLADHNLEASADYHHHSPEEATQDNSLEEARMPENSEIHMHRKKMIKKGKMAPGENPSESWQKAADDLQSSGPVTKAVTKTKADIMRKLSR